MDFEQGGRLFDRLRHPYFTLLVTPGNDDATAACERIKRRFGVGIDVEALPVSAAFASSGYDLVRSRQLCKNRHKDVQTFIQQLPFDVDRRRREAGGLRRLDFPLDRPQQ